MSFTENHYHAIEARIQFPLNAKVDLVGLWKVTFVSPEAEIDSETHPMVFFVSSTIDRLVPTLVEWHQTQYAGWCAEGESYGGFGAAGTDEDVEDYLRDAGWLEGEWSTQWLGVADAETERGVLYTYTE